MATPPISVSSADTTASNALSGISGRVSSDTGNLGGGIVQESGTPWAMIVIGVALLLLIWKR